MGKSSFKGAAGIKLSSVKRPSRQKVEMGNPDYAGSVDATGSRGFGGFPDGRPKTGDDKKGATRWPMGEGKVVDSGQGAKKISFGPGASN